MSESVSMTEVQALRDLEEREVLLREAKKMHRVIITLTVLALFSTGGFWWGVFHGSNWLSAGVVLSIVGFVVGVVVSFRYQTDELKPARKALRISKYKYEDAVVASIQRTREGL